MKIVVVGGTGLIGSKLIEKLRGEGHRAESASPASGVNTLTGEGLAAALEGVAVLVDVTNSPSFEDAAVLRFFQTSTRTTTQPTRQDCVSCAARPSTTPSRWRLSTGCANWPNTALYPRNSGGWPEQLHQKI